MDKKLPKDYENPIDQIFIDICDNTKPYFKMFNITPNMITTLSVISTLLSAYYINKDSYMYAILFYLLNWYFDTLDGIVARTYNMGSTFGAYYDTISDMIGNAIILYVLYQKYTQKNMFDYKFVLGLIFLSAMSLLYYECREKYLGKKIGFFKVTAPICSSTKVLPQYKYFGPGTTVMYIAFLMLNLEYKFTTTKN